MFRVLLVVCGAFGIAVSAPAFANGKAVYDAKCAACHAAGVAGAPKLGDKAAWAPRVKAGEAALIQSVVKGKNAMPPRAGQNASDKEIKESIEYMLSTLK
ncbi:MAG TPA: c-type cytochrome [Burkholderiales bacterium]|jgi:cytochrome c5